MIIGGKGKFFIEVKGARELDALLKTMPDRAKAATRKALQDSAADLKQKAIDLAPKKTGDLRGSAFYQTEISATGLEAIVGFDEPYATRQHEELDWKHTDGQAKYLETPYKENLPTYVDNIGAAIKGVLEH